ncbi:TRAP transporter small permease [Oceanobacillus luteolus]|uniref:TRAP transporter small permease n=1 Tax=Oceanobacillus luteolus TaxID=1274358 RepID=A0ABW4HMZ7_9BACI
MDIKSFLDKKLEEWVLIISLIILVLIVFVQVLSRYFLNYSFAWSEEIARYILIWVAWISVSYSIRRQEHLRIEFLKDRFSPTVQKYIELVVLILWFLFAIFLAIEGTNVILGIQSSGQTSPSIGMPMWIAYLAIPVGGLLMTIRLIQQVYFLFRGNKRGGI